MFTFVLTETADYGFAFRLEDVQEVLLLPRLVDPLSYDPPDVEGWLVLPESRHPVRSLARALKLDEEPPALSHHLVLVRDAVQTAWRVRETLEVIHQSGSDLEIISSGDRDFAPFSASFRRGNQVFRILSLEALLRGDQKKG